MDQHDKNLRAARRRDNAIAGGAILAGTGVAAGGYGAIKASRSIKSGVDDLKKTASGISDTVNRTASTVSNQVQKTGETARQTMNRTGDAVQKTGESLRQNSRRVAKVAGAPGRAVAKGGRFLKRLRKAVGLQAHFTEIHNFRASEVKKGTMMIDGILVDVAKLEKIIKDKKVIEVPFKDVKGIERTKGLSKERLRNVAAVLDKPGIISTDGTLIDGRHRARMRMASGVRFGLFRKATKADLKEAAVSQNELSSNPKVTNLMFAEEPPVKEMTKKKKKGIRIAGRTLRLFAAKDKPRKMKPGVYHGERPVRVGKIDLPVNHEYVAVIPRKHEKLDKGLQRKLRRIGPNGEKGIVYGAYNDNGILTPDMNRRSDADAFRSGKGFEYVSGRGVDKSAKKLAEHTKKTGKRKYPNLAVNAVGKGKNSNTYARSALKEIGIQREPKRWNPGSSLDFSEKPKRDRNPYGLNKEERIAQGISRGEGIAKATIGGGLAGGALAGPVGAAVGAGAAGAAQVGMQHQSERKQRERKPIQAAAIRAILPTAGGIGIGYGIRNSPKIQRVMKKTKAVGRLLQKRLKNLEARIDAVTEFARYDEPRRGPGQEGAGQFIGGRPVGWGKETPYVLNPHHKPLKPGRVDRRQAHEKESLVRDTRAPIMIPAVRKSFVRDAQTVNKWGGRAVRAGKDVADVVRGKPRQKDAAGRDKKREWEKSYAKNAIATGATTAGLFVVARKVRNSPKAQAKLTKAGNALRGARDKTLEGLAKYAMETGELHRGMITELARGDQAKRFIDHLSPGMSRNLGDFGEALLKRDGKKFGKIMTDMTGIKSSKRVTEESLKAGRGDMAKNMRESRKGGANRIPKKKPSDLSVLTQGTIHEFVSVTDDRGRQVFRVEDARGNSARIHAGDKPKRDRREKRWHEKVENERKLWGAGALVAGGAGLAVGAKGKEISSSVKGSKLYQGAKKSKVGGYVSRGIERATSPKRKLIKEIAKRGAMGLAGKVN